MPTLPKVPSHSRSKSKKIDPATISEQRAYDAWFNKVRNQLNEQNDEIQVGQAVNPFSSSSGLGDHVAEERKVINMEFDDVLFLHYV